MEGGLVMTLNPNASSGKAVLLDVDDTVRTIPWPADTGDNLRAMYAAIGCRGIELVRLRGGLDMWIDDEGKFPEDAKVNSRGTFMAWRALAIDRRDVICGRALLTGRDAEDTVALTHGELADLGLRLGVLLT